MSRSSQTPISWSSRMSPNDCGSWLQRPRPAPRKSASRFRSGAPMRRRMTRWNHSSGVPTTNSTKPRTSAGTASASEAYSSIPPPIETRPSSPPKPGFAAICRTTPSLTPRRTAGMPGHRSYNLHSAVSMGWSEELSIPLSDGVSSVLRHQPVAAPLAFAPSKSRFFKNEWRNGLIFVPETVAGSC